MTMARKRWYLSATMLVMATLPRTLPAQTLPAQERAYPRWYLGVAGEYGHATGDAESYIRDGGGLSMFGAWRAGRTSPFALRMNGNVLIYGNKTDTYEVLPGINVDVTTTNTLAGFGVGPEYIAGGRHLEAFVFATVGGTYIATTTALSGGNSDATTQLDDFALSGEAGGGLLVHLNPGVAIEAGARYRYTGEITYLPRGGMQLIGGQWAPNAVTSEVGLVLYHLGVTLKLGGIRPHREAVDEDGDKGEGIR